MAMRIRRLVEEDPEEIGKHPLSLKQPFRLMVVGGSNMGKTYAVLPIILDWLIVDNLYVFAKFLHTKLYEKFREEVDEKIEEGEIEDAVFSSELEDLRPQEFDPEKNNVVIIDDMINEKNLDKKRIGLLYTAGRHNNASVVSIFQGFVNGSPKYSRGCASHLFLFPGLSEDDLKAIYRTYSLADLGGFKNFLELYNRYVKKQGDFLFVDLFSKNPPFTKYRFQMSRFYNPRTRSFINEPRNLAEIPKLIEKLKKENGGSISSELSALGTGTALSGEDDLIQIIVGEVRSGNNSPLLKRQLKSVLDKKIREGSMTADEASKIYFGTFKK